MALLSLLRDSAIRTGAFAALGMLCLLAAAPAEAQVAAGEYEIKAAFLYNFAKFVTWPEDRLSSGEPIVIGLVGDDPFGGTIDLIAQKPANGHRVTVRRLRWNDDLSGCHILFIASSELARLPLILEGTRRLTILTVGDFDRFAPRGGMIELHTNAGRVRLEINLAAIQAAGLKVSSKLLQVASIVETAGAR
jgi:hypothetical protein